MANCLGWASTLLSSPKSVWLLATLAFGLCSALRAQELTADAWNGEWIAEGTLFRIGVMREGNLLKITQLESLGFEWISGDALVVGPNKAEVFVDYVTGGVKGIIDAELLNANTGVLRVRNCAPDFMVSCFLAKGRQAIFRKLAASE